jgi:hypothetical protein
LRTIYGTYVEDIQNERGVALGKRRLPPSIAKRSRRKTTSETVCDLVEAYDSEEEREDDESEGRGAEDAKMLKEM